MEKDPVCGTKGGETAESWDWNTNSKRNPTRSNLKPIVYQRQKLPPQITNLSEPHLRLPTPHTSGCAEELRCPLLGINTLSFFGINTLDLSFYCPSTFDV